MRALGLAAARACPPSSPTSRLRARASFHILRAAYPAEQIPFRMIWGAYLAAYGFNGSCRRAAAT